MKVTFWKFFFLSMGLAGLLSVQPALADKGMLRIVTEPGDAQLFINGARKGNSPAEAGQSFAIKLNQGEYTVSALKAGSGANEGYAEKKIYVADDSLQTVTLKLEDRVSQTVLKAVRQKYAKYLPVPEMVALPAGRFRMGCLESDKECQDDEKPVLHMTVAAFEIGKYEVTFEQWDACFAQGGCEHYPSDEGWGRGKRPVLNVSWDDIHQYLAWLNKKTGKEYRLLSEPEWEYAARAGTETVYSWGDQLGKNRANCEACGSQWDNKKTAPVGSFAPNPWGLHDMHGNVGEWVSGCNWRYEGSSTDASRWHSDTKCEYRVVRGGSCYDTARVLRSAYRYSSSPGKRDNVYGFRLARTR